MHRWASIAFVVVLPFALILQESIVFGVLATAAIAVSLVTGLQMNGRHYLTRWRRRSARATRSGCQPTTGLRARAGLDVGGDPDRFGGGP